RSLSGARPQGTAERPTNRGSDLPASCRLNFRVKRRPASRGKRRDSLTSRTTPEDLVALVFPLLALAGRFVIPPALEGRGPVVLLDEVARVVVRVLVALPVPQPLRSRVVGVPQVEGDGFARDRVLRGA